MLRPEGKAMAGGPTPASPAARRPNMALVVVLHGRMGGLGSLMVGAPPRAQRSVEGAQPSVSSAALCAASLERHVLAPNRHRFDIDVVGHSWSPEIGATLDGLYAPVRSMHERGLPQTNFRCPNASFAPHYCHRTVSHLLGITRAMRLKAEEEAARRRTYDLVFLSRWDILWQARMHEATLAPPVGWAPPRASNPALCARARSRRYSRSIGSTDGTRCASVEGVSSGCRAFVCQSNPEATTECLCARAYVAAPRRCGWPRKPPTSAPARRGRASVT